jgi:cell division protein FtsB
LIHRARLFFVVALLVAVGILVANFPFGTLLSARTTIQGESARLAALRATDQRLASEVRALHDPSTVGQIAHQEYGLITSGQRSIVVLPGSSGSRSSARNPLADNPVPSADLLPSDAILDPGSEVAPPPSHGPGFWHRVIGSLEFWHSLF